VSILCDYMLLLVLAFQIDEWLAHRPSDLESYIKPGCVVLTVFLSMPKSGWVELKEDLAASVKKLLSLCNDNFWCKGRILVQAEHQKVFVVDGKCCQPEVSSLEDSKSSIITIGLVV
jgi:hypothetical protein